MIHRRASANAVINQILSRANGIGQSKTEAKNQSATIGQNGQTVSTKAHSIKSLQNLRSITKQYINFIKEQHGNRVVNHLNNETMKEFINHKLESGTSQGSVNTYISTLAKVSDVLNEMNIHTTSREEITAYRTELKEFGYHLQKNHENRAYNNPQTICEVMKQNSPYFLSSQLTYEVGLRADDAINSNKWRLNDDNTLHIKGSKNGLNYTTAPLSKETVQRVREAINEGYKVSYSEFRESLKEAVESVSGEKWDGIHGMRYSYAQERQAETSKEETSLTMGHSRSEIVDIYLI